MSELPNQNYENNIFTTYALIEVINLIRKTCYTNCSSMSPGAINTLGRLSDSWSCQYYHKALATEGARGKNTELLCILAPFNKSLWLPTIQGEWFPFGGIPLPKRYRVNLYQYIHSFSFSFFMCKGVNSNPNENAIRSRLWKFKIKWDNCVWTVHICGRLHSNCTLYLHLFS